MRYHSPTSANRNLSELAFSRFNLGPHTGTLNQELVGESKDYYKIKVNFNITAYNPTRKSIQESLPEMSILFVGGIHGREWLTSECLYELIKYLYFNAENYATDVPELLNHVNVWIIPFANPAGRMIDDLGNGDPTNYHQGEGNTEFGWRYNGDIRQCKCAKADQDTGTLIDSLLGVDLARNFSIGWNGADKSCGTYKNTSGDVVTAHYRGVAPFSTTEATSLRNFVQNHMISMAIDFHSNGQYIYNLYGANDKAGKTMKSVAEAMWADLCDALASSLNITDHKLGLIQETISGGGQFSVWLAEDRAIQTFCFELPFNDYYGTIYQDRPNDGSNSFHPSGDSAGNFISDVFIPVACYFIRQARIPGRAFVNYASQTLSNPVNDFGIVAAKVGRSKDGAGSLISFPSNSVISEAFDTIDPGEYQVYYCVQNNSDMTGTCDVKLEIESEMRSYPFGHYSRIYKSHQNISLDSLQRSCEQFSINCKKGFNYRLTLKVIAKDIMDDFEKNNEKYFEFKVWDSDLYYRLREKSRIQVNYRIKAKHSGKCLDVTESSKESGTQIIQWSCHGGDNQKFKLEPMREGYYRIEAKHSGKCLDVTEDSKVIQRTWHANDNQMFELEPIEGESGYYRIKAKHSGKCLDVTGSSKESGTQIIQWICHKGDNQKFKMEPSVKDEGGFYRIRARHSGKCLDVTEDSKVIQRTWRADDNQKFKLEPIEGECGYYRIKAKHSGKYLNVIEDSKVIQRTWHANDNQMFELEPIEGKSGYYRIKAKHSGKCLDVTGSSKESGTQIIQWICHKGDNQKFKLEFVGWR